MSKKGMRPRKFQAGGGVGHVDPISGIWVTPDMVSPGSYWNPNQVNPYGDVNNPTYVQSLAPGQSTLTTYMSPQSYAAQQFAYNTSPFMTPAAIANQAAVGNAGLPSVIDTATGQLTPMGQANVDVNGQNVPWSSMTPMQQSMYGYYQTSGQRLPSDFMSAYQGPNAPWNDPNLNTIGVPEGSAIQNGALVNAQGQFTVPGSFSGNANVGTGTGGAGTGFAGAVGGAGGAGGTGSTGGIAPAGTFTAGSTGAGTGTEAGAGAPVTGGATDTGTNFAGAGQGMGFARGGKVRRFQDGGSSGGQNQDPTQQALAAMQQAAAQQQQQRQAAGLAMLQGQGPRGFASGGSSDSNSSSSSSAPKDTRTMPTTPGAVQVPYGGFQFKDQQGPMSPVLLNPGLWFNTKYSSGVNAAAMPGSSGASTPGSSALGSSAGSQTGTTGTTGTTGSTTPSQPMVYNSALVSPQQLVNALYPTATLPQPAGTTSATTGTTGTTTTRARGGLMNARPRRFQAGGQNTPQQQAAQRPQPTNVNFNPANPGPGAGGIDRSAVGLQGYQAIPGMALGPAGMPPPSAARLAAAGLPPGGSWADIAALNQAPNATAGVTPPGAAGAGAAGAAGATPAASTLGAAPAGLPGGGAMTPQAFQQAAAGMPGGMGPMQGMGGMPGMGGMGGSIGMGMPPGMGGMMGGGMPQAMPQGGQFAPSVTGTPGAGGGGVNAGMMPNPAAMQAGMMGQMGQMGGAMPGMGAMGGGMPGAGAAAPGAGAGPGMSFGPSATPSQQWGQMLLGGAPGTGQGSPQQALYRNYLGQLAGGMGMQRPGGQFTMTGGAGMGMASGGEVPSEPDEYASTGSHYRVPLRGGEHERASHPDQQWGLVADGERRYATGGRTDVAPRTHATGVPMSRRKATGGRSDTLPARHASGVPYRKATGGDVDTAPTRHASGVKMSSSPSGGQSLGPVSKFDSTKGGPGNLRTGASGRGRGFSHGGVNRTMDSTKPAPGNLPTSKAGVDRFAAGGPSEAVKPKTSRNVLRRRPAPRPQSPVRRRAAPPTPVPDSQGDMDISPTGGGISPGISPAVPSAAAPPAGPPPMGMARGGNPRLPPIGRDVGPREWAESDEPDIRNQRAALWNTGDFYGPMTPRMQRDVALSARDWAESEDPAIRNQRAAMWNSGDFYGPMTPNMQRDVALSARDWAEANPEAARQPTPGMPGFKGARGGSMEERQEGSRDNPREEAAERKARGGAVKCPSCGKAHGGACKGMRRGGKFAGAKQRQVKFAEGGKNWIQGAIKRPGALRAKLGVKEGETIPAKKLAKAKQSSNPTTRRQANLASTLKGFKHAEGGPIKLAIGGVGKIRKGFPGMNKAPKRLARGGTVRGSGAAVRGTKFSGVY